MSAAFEIASIPQTAQGHAGYWYVYNPTTKRHLHHDSVWRPVTYVFDQRRGYEQQRLWTGLYYDRTAAIQALELRPD